jgi:hypothetical protein
MREKTWREGSFLLASRRPPVHDRGLSSFAFKEGGLVRARILKTLWLGQLFALEFLFQTLVILVCFIKEASIPSTVDPSTCKQGLNGTLHRLIEL